MRFFRDTECLKICHSYSGMNSRGNQRWMMATQLRQQSTRIVYRSRTPDCTRLDSFSRARSHQTQQSSLRSAARRGADDTTDDRRQLTFAVAAIFGLETTPKKSRTCFEFQRCIHTYKNMEISSDVSVLLQLYVVGRILAFIHTKMQ